MIEAPLSNHVVWIGVFAASGSDSPKDVNVSKSPKVSPPQDIKNDAKGAFAPSQADSHNNGALAIDPNETDPSKHKDNTHPAPTPKDASKE